MIRYYQNICSLGSTIHAYSDCIGVCQHNSVSWAIDSYLVFAVLGRALVLPVRQGSLGFGTALQKRAAVLHAVHRFIQERRLPT